MQISIFLIHFYSLPLPFLIGSHRCSFVKSEWLWVMFSLLNRWSCINSFYFTCSTLNTMSSHIPFFPYLIGQVLMYCAFVAVIHLRHRINRIRIAEWFTKYCEPKYRNITPLTQK